MGSKLLLLALLLVYFCTFYFHLDSGPLPKPNAPAPAPPAKPNLRLEATTHSMFRLLADNAEVMKHAFSSDHGSYWVHKADQIIMERDDCQPYPHALSIAAKKFGLYRHLRTMPDENLIASYERDSPYTAFGKDVFYFACDQRRVGFLDMCGSGKIFQNHRCVDVTACTGKPDNSSIPHLGDVTKFVVCSNGREFVRHCPPGHFFYHTRCVSKTDLTHRCQFEPDSPAPSKLDDRTLFECRDGRPVLTRCEPGTRVLDGATCEPEDCLGRPDGARLPMKERRRGPFVFWPGYVECRGERVVDPPVECPQSWDPWLTREGDTTSLPMVFDGTRCAVPSFCDNVWSEDPETVVPLHDFTKRVRNWKLSGVYDASAGYVCEGAGRGAKRKLVTFDADRRIDAKKFKPAPACDDPSRHYLPIHDMPDQYYDCIQDRVVGCPVNQYFDGDACRNRPTGFPVFEHRNLAMFHFDSLNSEGWIPPWEYGKDKAPACSGGHDYLRVYNVCVHPECEKYAFLSMVPELSVLLPHGRNAKCTFYEADRHVRLETVDELAGAYTFWDQKLWADDDPNRGDGPCTVGQTLQTGHFVWDSTVRATCDYEQPFVFCPSPLSGGIEKIADHLYACSPPPGNRVLHTVTTEQYGPNAWTPFAENEVKGILPFVWDGVLQYFFKLWRRDPAFRALPEHGFHVPVGSRFNFQVNRPVWLELRYRVTLPPNVAYKYDEVTNARENLFDADGRKGFHVRHQAFQTLSMKFPRFRSTTHVFQFTDTYLH